MALDFGRLTHTLDSIIQKTVSPSGTSYMNGGILVELKDFRHVGVENVILPITGKVFLQPTQQALVEGMSCELQESLIEVCIYYVFHVFTVQYEETLLKAVSPVCLDPSTNVFYSLNMAHHNDFKSVMPHKPEDYASRAVPCRKRIHPRYSNSKTILTLFRPSMTVPPNKRPKIDVVRFLKKIGKPPDMNPLLVPVT